MKNTGIVMIIISILALFPGALMAFHTPPPHYLDESRLSLAESAVTLCNYGAILEEPKSCAAEEAELKRAQAEMPVKDPVEYLWGYAILSVAPFFILIGTVLFAAGKVEDAVKALGQQAVTPAP